MIDRRTFLSSLTGALAALAAAGVRSAERADEVSPRPGIRCAPSGLRRSNRVWSQRGFAPDL